MSIQTKIISTLLVAALFIGAVIIIQNKKVALAEVSPMKSYAMIVSTMRVEKSAVSLSLPYLASIQSDKNVALTSRISVRVESIIKCGSTVHKGDVLVRLDAKDLKARKIALALQIASVKADLVGKRSLLQTTQQSHARTKALLEIKGASQESFDKEKSTIAGLVAVITALENQIGILKSSISQINTSLTYTVLRSPIDGIASECFANVGDISMPGKPLLNIESENGKYLLVRSSQNVKPKALRYEDEEYPLIPMQNTYNGLNEYRAYIPTMRSSGERVNISLIVYSGLGIQLPLDALLQKEFKTYCLIVKEDRAQAVEIQIQAQGEEGVVIEGLKEGSEVVLAKSDILLKLLSGVPLTVRNK